MYNISTKVGKQSIKVSLSEQNATVLDLKQEFYRQSNTSMTPSDEIDFSLSKIIYKGNQLTPDDQLLSNWFQDSTQTYKVMVLITKQNDVNIIHQSVQKHSEATLNYQRALKSRPKHDIVDMGYCKKVEPLEEFNDKEAARNLLQKIRDDYGIKTIMREREWRVSLLKELHPNEKTILGYNQNKGQIIALRLRTDDLSGFRSYESIIKVMLHELAHMIFSEHDEHFHRLDRELNAQWQRNKGHVLARGAYGTSIQPEYSVNPNGQVLGGKGVDVNADKREILANAALSRLTKEEAEITNGCQLGH
ncbi:hypothetical protein HDV02_003247 [Globomyces sp. JEL0801]|nr:hypothetical protein HDV02_003247 [Globomyces sp. JEL0801]